MKLDVQKIDQLIPQDYLNREVQGEIESVLGTEEVIVLYGARQVGKSSLVLNLAKQLVHTNSVYYFTLDNVDNPDFSDPARLLSLLSSDLNVDRTTYLIIDEAQRKRNIGLFIKQIYDQKLPLKIILTGSASFAIRSDINEPLTGRKFEFHLSPFSLAEIFKHVGIDYTKLESPNTQTDGILSDYLIYGGYPKVYFTQSHDLKVKRLIEIADTYITRDLVELFGIEDISSVRKVTAYIAENIGNLLSIDKITSLGGLKRSEVEMILNALESIFVSYSLLPYSSDKFKEVVQRPKIYFHDTGLRNAFLRKFDENFLLNDKGSLFENTIGNQLVQRYGTHNVHFWRTINQTEIDFVVKKSEQLLAYECKYSWDVGKKTKALMSFAETYPANTFVLSTDNYWEYLKW